MNIKNVKIKNFKGIKIIDVSTEKNMIFISGQNGAGKSSFCDAIMTCLAGKDKAITRPIRNGASKAEIEIELDGYRVRRVFTQTKGAKLSVNPTGKMEGLKSPQAWLNAHIGNLKFDPSEFAKLDEKKQRDILMKLAGLNLDEEDEKIIELENERLFLGRDLKNLVKPTESEMHNAKLYADKEEININDLTEKYNSLLEKQRKISSAEEETINNISKIEELKSEIASLEARNKELEQVPGLEHDPDEIKNKIANVDEDNKNIRQSQKIFQDTENYNNKEKEHQTKDEEVKAARDTKQQLIEAAEYPIDGLSVSDDGVLYNDVPFSQISDSQKLIIGTLIVLALMPKEDPIKIIFLKSASLFDQNAINYLEKIAIEQDAKFVLEFAGGNKGIIIEEGELINSK